MSTSARERLDQLVAHAFAVNGWLVAEGFRYLPQQEAYARQVAAWIGGAAEKPAGAIEASTGIGKSIGYLVPAFCWAALTGVRIGISTFTINLQRQLLHGDIVLAQRFLQSQGFAALAIGHFLGRGNYLNARRIERLLIGSSDTRRDWLHQLQAWSEPDADGTLQGFVEYYGELPAELSVREVCLQAHDADSDAPVFQLQRNAIPNANIIVTSHAVMVLNAAAHARNLMQGESDILPAMDAVIFDEADRLESAADFLQKRLTLNQLSDLIDHALREHAAFSSPNMLKSLLVLLKAVNHLNAHLMQLPDTDSDRPLLATQFQPRTRQLLTRLTVALKRAVAHWDRETAIPATATLEELIDISRWLERYTQAGAPNSHHCGVMWSPVQHLPSLYEYRLDPQSILSSDIRYRRNDAPLCRKLFTSATLSDANASHAFRFKSFWAALRIKPEYVCCEFSCAPKKFGAMDFVLSAFDAPAPFDDSGATPELCSEWLEYCALLLERVAEHGPALVLTSSYDETARLSEILQVPHIAHRRGTKLGAVLAAFQQQKTMLLTPAAWEGVSLRRADGTQLFRELVITRLPFKRTSEEELAALRVSAQQRRSGTTAESIAFTRRLNEVKRKLQQGMGRGIRAASDTCRLWIADSRFPLPGAMSTFSSLRSAIPERFWCDYEAAEIFTRTGALETSHHLIAAYDAVAMNYL